MKHRKLTTILSILFFAFSAFGQCDVVAIPKNDWTIHFVDSEETAGEGNNNGKAIHAIDGVQSTFWHTQWQGAQPGYPHDIQINLNGTHDVVGAYAIKYSDAPISLSLTENKVKKELEMVLYPNPTKDAFRINVNNQWKNIAVSVLDVSGQTVSVRFFKTEQDLNQATIDLSNVPSGMYFVKIQSEGEFATMRVVKQ